MIGSPAWFSEVGTRGSNEDSCAVWWVGDTLFARRVQDPSLRELCSDPDHTFEGEPDPRNRVGALTYVDLAASWCAPCQGIFTFGVRSALDRNPPLAHSALANSCFADYDIPGRYFYASYRQSSDARSYDLRRGSDRCASNRFAVFPK
jgi:iron complex outermembrane receptor protein